MRSTRCPSVTCALAIRPRHWSSCLALPWQPRILRYKQPLPRKAQVPRNMISGCDPTVPIICNMCIVRGQPGIHHRTYISSEMMHLQLAEGKITRLTHVAKSKCLIKAFTLGLLLSPSARIAPPPSPSSDMHLTRWVLVATSCGSCESIWHDTRGR